MKQITIQVPAVVYDRAVKESKKIKRKPDGLKLLPSAVLREWLLKGMEYAEK